MEDVAVLVLHVNKAFLVSRILKIWKVTKLRTFRVVINALCNHYFYLPILRPSALKIVKVEM